MGDEGREVNKKKLMKKATSRQQIYCRGDASSCIPPLRKGILFPRFLFLDSDLWIPLVMGNLGG